MRIVRALTAKEVAAIKKEGLTCIGGVRGLYLMVKGVSRYYVLRHVAPGGRRTFVSVGNAAEMSLADARALALELSFDVADGVDIAQRRRDDREARQLEKKLAQEQDEHLFSVLAYQWLEARVASGYYKKNVRGASVARSYLNRNILPHLGKKRIEDITHKDVFECVKELWLTTTEAKHKCLTIISGVCKWAIAMDIYQGLNPADARGPLGVLLENLSPHAKTSMNRGALAPESMPDFFSELLSWGTVASKAFAFAILTAARSKQVRTARWSDINLEDGTWACPETAMKVKGRGIFVVVLSSAAIDLLNSLPRFAGNDLVFPSSVRGGVISDAGIGQVVTDMNKAAKKEGRAEWIDVAQTETSGHPVRITVHGTSRATFKTWTRLDSNLNRFDRDAVELCLAHKLDDGYGGAYDRATLIEERRRIMNAWGEYCVSKVKHVANPR